MEVGGWWCFLWSMPCLLEVLVDDWELEERDFCLDDRAVAWMCCGLG